MSISIYLGDLLIVATSRIDHSKSWCYLGPFQTSQVELFVKIIFAYRLFILFFSLGRSFFSFIFVVVVVVGGGKGAWRGATSLHWFHKALPINSFLCFVSQDFCILKKKMYIYIRMLEFTFLTEDEIN